MYILWNLHLYIWGYYLLYWYTRRFGCCLYFRLQVMGCYDRIVLLFYYSPGGLVIGIFSNYWKGPGFYSNSRH
jgi:hypothetical protein